MEENKIPLMCRLCLTRKQFLYDFIDRKNNWTLKIKQLTGIDVINLTFPVFIFLFY